jgi:SynChlorMet cassette protein ScmC
MLANQLMQLSLVIAQQAQNTGGILLHGALIEKDGWGAILAGPGGVGKTTASCRLRSPWRSLSDDVTLVVRGKHGTYWAHPWPTWSNYMLGGKGGTWDVEHAVELKAIFFLAQSQGDRIRPLGAGHSVPLLVEVTEQASWSMAHGQGGAVARALRLQRFENICSLAKSKICYHLHLSLKGAFWKEIERVITRQEKKAS